MNHVLQGLGDFLRRYAAVFGAAWTNRHAMQSPPRTAEEIEFLPAHLELMETPPACQGAQTPPHGTTQVVIAVVNLRGRHIEHPQTRLAIGLDQRLHGYPPLLLQACGAQPGRRSLAERPPHCSDPNGQNQGPIRPVLRTG